MTERSMVDKCAAAICEARNKFFAVDVEHKVEGLDFDVMLARAAIEALREPTEAMWAAGEDTNMAGISDSGGAERDYYDIEKVWDAMIDEALKP